MVNVKHFKTNVKLNMVNVKHFKTNVIVVLKLVVIFIVIKIVIRNTVMPSHRNTVVYNSKDVVAVRLRKGTISVNGTKIKDGRPNVGSLIEDIGNSKIKSESHLLAVKSHLSDYSSYNSKMKKSSEYYSNGNSRNQRYRYQNIKNYINNKVSNNSDISWVKIPPFSTHSLSELEILHSQNISAVNEDLEPSYLWHSKIGSMDKISKTRRRFPRCIIIGVNKAGTLALLKFLSLHPNITIPKTNSQGKNEVKFFNIHYSKGYNYYLREMPVSKPGQITIEKSPGYFRSSVAPLRIHRFYKGRVKLILIVRDPIDRTVSEYMQKRVTYRNRLHGVNGNESSYPTFEDIVTIQNSAGRKQLNTSHKLITNSIYHLHTQRWIELFSRDQIHIVNGDNLKANPLQELQNIETFLGLNPELKHEHFYYNRTKGFYCYKTELGSGNIQCLKKDKGLKHPDIDPGVLEQMYRYFVPFNLAFNKLVGQDFGWVKT